MIAEKGSYSFFRAWLEGMRRVTRAPAAVAGIWALTLLVAAPMAAVMRDAIRSHLGASLAADRALAGVNYDWMQEFGAGATGLAATFKTDVIGFAAVLDNASAFLDRDARPIAIAGAAAVYLALLLFLSGGIIDRVARDHATGAHGFFSACGVFFFRFLRLAVLMGAVYWLLFQRLHPWLFDTLYDRLTHEVAVERTAFLVRALLYLAFGLAVAACNLVFDYAKVRAVVEDRRSMVVATIAAVRFIRRNFAGAAGLYLLDLLLFLLVLALYALVAPGAGSGGWSVWAAFAAGQAYLLARLWVKVVFWASEAALFQGRLAHAGYVAAPKPVWPDSPSVSALSP